MTDGMSRDEVARRTADSVDEAVDGVQSGDGVVRVELDPDAEDAFDTMLREARREGREEEFLRDMWDRLSADKDD